jgi:hypothetical protein
MPGEPDIDLQQRDPFVIEWKGSYSRAFQRCLNILGALGADLVDADPNHGFLEARCGPSLRGFGYAVRIEFQTHLEWTSVRLQSIPRFSLLDWGAADGFLARFKEAWDRMPDANEGIESTE